MSLLPPNSCLLLLTYGFWPLRLLLASMESQADMQLNDGDNVHGLVFLHLYLPIRPSFKPTKLLLTTTTTTTTTITATTTTPTKMLLILYHKGHQETLVWLSRICVQSHQLTIMAIVLMRFACMHTYIYIYVYSCTYLHIRVHMCICISIRHKNKSNSNITVAKTKQ